MNPQYNRNSFTRIEAYQLSKDLYNHQRLNSSISLDILLETLTAIRKTINSHKCSLEAQEKHHLLKLAKTYNSMLKCLPDTLDHDFTPIIF
ncbi:MAG: hypothetical protein FD155_3395 [Bacteroidetes bacterium]|nr:MAG: hypothetical protein FD155_3395 [Bacteroidota bacterium]